MVETYKWGGDCYFSIFTMDQISTSTNAGVFIFAGKKTSLLWKPYYIGDSDSFQKLTAHPMWEKAKKEGATHVHVLTVGENQRKIQATQLIDKYQAILNSEDEKNQRSAK